MTMTMREAVEVILAGRRAAVRVGHQFLMDDERLRNVGFSQCEVMAIRRHVLEIEDMLRDRMDRIR